MGCGPSKPKVLYRPLPAAPTATRIFTWETARAHNPMRMDLGLQTDLAKCQAFFVIKYNKQDPSPAMEELLVNGHIVRIPQPAANALRTIVQNPDVFLALTNNWCPWFWMDCVCVNPADAAEVTRQRELEPLICAAAKWTLDCTGPVAQIKLGINAYQSAILAFGPTVGDDIRAVLDSVTNLERMRGHEAGRVVWTAPAR